MLMAQYRDEFVKRTIEITDNIVSAQSADNQRDTCSSRKRQNIAQNKETARIMKNEQDKVRIC
jgi:hypothetical protein